MYDTKTRIALVKKRMHEYHRRQERRTVLYAQYTIVFFGDSIDDLKTVTMSVTVLFTGFIFSIRDSQVILIAGVFTFNKQKISL